MIMKTAAVVSVLALAGAAVAQNVVDVAVGLSTGVASDIFQFQPPNVTANAGDIVRFTFSGSPGNHSVTQSSFATPCEPVEGGFSSGNIFIPPSLTTGFPTWNLTITNTSKPLWFYCTQLAPSPHCNAGMVGSINAATNGSNTFDAFLAEATTHSGDSGQTLGFLVGQGASASAVPGPFTGSISGFNLPVTSVAGAASGSASAGASGSASGSASAASTSPSSGAEHLKAGSLVVLFSAVFGVMLA